MAHFIVTMVLMAACGLVSGQGDRGSQTGRLPNFPDNSDLPGGSIHSLPPEYRCTSGFSVRKVTGGTAVARGSFGTRLRFQDVLTGEGGWSNSESDFLAPCTGLYYFSFHGVAPEGGDFTLVLIKNGQYQVTAYGGKGSFQQGSNSALLLLNEGDLVHLELQQGSLYEHPANEAYTSFTGFMVKELQ